MAIDLKDEGAGVKFTSILKGSFSFQDKYFLVESTLHQRPLITYLPLDYPLAVAIGHIKKKRIDKDPTDKFVLGWKRNYFQGCQQ